PQDAAPARARSFTHLVALQKGGDRTPFFIVAGMFGNVLNLRQLAIEIGRDRPVYGLQARGLIGDDAPHARIEDAARDYLAEIARVQPQGPYLLGGFSGGGITACEMAQQLRAAGQEVAVLALLDTPLPVRPALTRGDRARIKLHEFRRKGLGYAREWLRARIDWQLRGRHQVATDAPQGAAAFNNRKIELAFREAVAAYRLQPWDGPMTLFRPPLDRHWKVGGGRWVSRAREYVLPDNDWTRFAPRVTVVEVPGDHDSMVLAPNVGVLAASLRAEIAQSEGNQVLRVSAAE
ncbi:MAG: polyketide synthase, partial [Rhodobacteraceae bacterium]